MIVASMSIVTTVSAVLKCCFVARYAHSCCSSVSILKYHYAAPIGIFSYPNSMAFADDLGLSDEKSLPSLNCLRNLIKSISSQFRITELLHLIPNHVDHLNIPVLSQSAQGTHITVRS